ARPLDRLRRAVAPVHLVRERRRLVGGRRVGRGECEGPLLAGHGVGRAGDPGGRGHVLHRDDRRAPHRVRPVRHDQRGEVTAVVGVGVGRGGAGGWAAVAEVPGGGGGVAVGGGRAGPVEGDDGALIHGPVGAGDGDRVVVIVEDCRHGARQAGRAGGGV